MTKNLVDRAKTKSINPHGNGHITLKRGVLTADVITVARAWYDEALFRNRIDAIHNHINLQIRENANLADPRNGKLNLRCAPPIESIVELEVNGVPIIADANTLPSLLVLEVIASNEPLPFSTLEAHIDQTIKSGEKRGVTDNSGPPDSPGWGNGPEELAKEFLRLDGNESTPGPAPPVIARIRLLSTRFTKMAAQPDIIRRLSNPGNKKKRPRNAETSKNSTGRGKSSGDPDTRQTEVTTSSPEQEGSSDGQSDTLSPTEAITSVINAFKMLIANDVSISTRCITEAKYEFRGYVFNVVPERASVRTTSWTYILKGQVRRPVLIAELKLDESYVYVIEIIRDVGDQFSTLIFCHADKRKIEDETFKKIFKALDSAKQLPNDASVKQALSGSTPPNENNKTQDELAVVKRVRHVTTDGSVLAYRLSAMLVAEK